jgi:hypothetical protein
MSGLSPAAQRSLTGTRRSSRNQDRVPPAYGAARPYKRRLGDQLYNDNRGGVFYAKLVSVANVDGKLTCEISTSNNVTKLVSLTAFTLMCPSPTKALAEVVVNLHDMTSGLLNAIWDERREGKRRLDVEKIRNNRLLALVTEAEYATKASGHRLLQTRRQNSKLRREGNRLVRAGDLLLAKYIQLRKEHEAFAAAFGAEPQIAATLPPLILLSSDEEASTEEDTNFDAAIDAAVSVMPRSQPIPIPVPASQMYDPTHVSPTSPSYSPVSPSYSPTSPSRSSSPEY